MCSPCRRFPCRSGSRRRRRLPPISRCLPRGGVIPSRRACLRCFSALPPCPPHHPERRWLRCCFRCFARISPCGLPRRRGSSGSPRSAFSRAARRCFSRFCPNSSSARRSPFCRSARRGKSSCPSPAGGQSRMPRARCCPIGKRASARPCATFPPPLRRCQMRLPGCPTARRGSASSMSVTSATRSVTGSAAAVRHAAYAGKGITP